MGTTDAPEANPVERWQDRCPGASPPPLWHNVSWIFAGNLSFAAAQWLMLVALARLGSPEIVGSFALATATTTPIMLFSNLQLRAVQATDARNDFLLQDYLGLRLTTTAFALLVIVVLAVFGAHGREHVFVLLALGAAKSTEALIDVYSGFFQRREQMRHVGTSLMVRGPLELMALSTVLWLTGSLALAVGSLAVARLAVLACHSLPTAMQFGTEVDRPIPRWHGQTLWRLARLSFPLGVVALAVSLTSAAPSYLAGHSLGEAQLGLFAAMASLVVPGGQVVIALGQAASPRLARLYAAGHDAEFKRLLASLLWGAAIIGIGALLVGNAVGGRVLSALYGPEYATRPDLLSIVMLTATVTYLWSVLGFALTSTRRFRPQAFMQSFLAVVAVACSLVLIPRLHLTGLALTALVVAVVACVTSLLLLTVLLRPPRLAGRRE